MDIVFDGALRTLAFHDPESGEVELVTVGVDEGGFGVELGEDATLGLDENDALAQLSLRERPGTGAVPGAVASALRESEDAPEAELAEAEWPVEREVTWRLEGSTLVVLVAGTTRSQWARIGASGLAVALDLEREGEAYVAALVHRAVARDPGFAQLAALG